MALFLSLSLLSCAIFSQSRENSRRWNGTTVQRRRKRKRKKKKKKRIMRMVHGRGMDHVYRTRFVKYQGRAKISATLLDVYKRSSIFRVLSHGSISRIYTSIMRGTGAMLYERRDRELWKTRSSRNHDRIFSLGYWITLCHHLLYWSPIDYYIVYNVTMGVAAMGPSTSRVDPNN